jgi:hypothetical protein
MPPGVALDTRTPYQSRETHLDTSAPSSLVGSAGLTLFRFLVQRLLGCPHRERAALREKVAARLREARDPVGYFNELLDQCVTGGGTDGLDIAIDVLSGVGSRTIEYAYEFWKQDHGRWVQANQSPRHHKNDDVWYILLRAMGASSLNEPRKRLLIFHCATAGSASIREAAIHALGELGDSVAVAFLRMGAERDPSPFVRGTAAMVLHDLEG